MVVQQVHEMLQKTRSSTREQEQKLPVILLIGSSILIVRGHIFNLANAYDDDDNDNDDE